MGGCGCLGFPHMPKVFKTDPEVYPKKEKPTTPQKWCVNVHGVIGDIKS